MKFYDYHRQLHAVSQLAEFRPTVVWKSGNVDFLSVIPWDGSMFPADKEVDKKDFTDSSLEWVAEFHNLTSLQIAGTRITDGGLSKLSHMHRLKELFLCECSITDGGLKYLAGLQQLEVLELNDTGVTEQGVMLLQSKLPKVRIYLQAIVGSTKLATLSHAESRKNGSY